MRPRVWGSLRDKLPFEINLSRLLVGGMCMLFGKDAFLGKTFLGSRLIPSRELRKPVFRDNY